MLMGGAASDWIPKFSSGTGPLTASLETFVVKCGLMRYPYNRYPVAAQGN